jgi:hypothetical protein
MTTVWTAQTGALATRMNASGQERNDVNGVAWLPHGRVLATAHGAQGQGEVRLWNPVNTTLLHVLTSPAGWLRGIAWSPDGQWLASARAPLPPDDNSPMIFHLPLVPRLFMANRQEIRLPIRRHPCEDAGATTGGAGVGTGGRPESRDEVHLLSEPKMRGPLACHSNFPPGVCLLFKPTALSASFACHACLFHSQSKHHRTNSRCEAGDKHHEST